MKNTLSCPQFSPQNAENRIIFLWRGGGGVEISKFSREAPPLSPHPPPRKKGLMAPCWYNELLFSNLLATSIYIETPVYSIKLLFVYLTVFWKLD